MIRVVAALALVVASAVGGWYGSYYRDRVLPGDVVLSRIPALER